MSNVAFSANLLWTLILGAAFLWGAACCLAYAMCRAADKPAPDAPYFRGADEHEPHHEPWALPFNVVDAERAEYAAAHDLDAELAELIEKEGGR